MTGAGTSTRRFFFFLLKSVKDDFCLENVEVPQSNPLGRANTILLCCFCESPVLVRKREREREGEGMSEGGVGWVEGWR